MTKQPAPLQLSLSQMLSAQPSKKQNALSVKQKSDGEAFLRIFPSERAVLAYFAPAKWAAAIANADKCTCHPCMTLYLLDRLPGDADQPIDQLPSVSEYQQVMDASNSFDSRETENRHRLDINFGYKFNKASYGQIWTLLDGDINFRLRHQGWPPGLGGRKL